MKENNSATCRSCHDYDAMDHAKQHPEAARQMKIAAKDNQSCIDCHKGIAHQLPDMSSGFRKQFDQLRANANDDGETLYSLDIKPIYAAKGDKEPAGSLLPASEVKVLKRDGDWLQIEIVGWTERVMGVSACWRNCRASAFCGFHSWRHPAAREDAGANHRCGNEYAME